MRAWTWQERRMLINGFREVNGARRTNHTGIKHMATNKMRIPDQTFFDYYPRFMVVPIMTPEQARDWDGRGYDAIVLMDLPGASSPTRTAAAGRMDMMQTGIFPLASNYDLDAAGELLQVMMLAIRYFITSAHADHNVPPNVYAEAGDPGLDQHRIWSETLFHVPCMLLNPLFLRVRKVQFAAASNWQDGFGHFGLPCYRRHMAPDPLLLAARAAFTFAALHGQRFAAGAEPPPVDEMDEFAEEQFLAQQRAGLRPPEDREELARALGQHPSQSV